MTSWTQQCIRHADVILVFADARENYSVSGFEEKVETSSLREGFKNKNDETYGIFNMLVDYLAQRMVVEGGGGVHKGKK